MKEIYYDHYKDSFEIQRSYLEKRDKLTVWLFLCVIVEVFQLSQPSIISEAVNGWLSAHVNGLKLEYEVINTAILLFWLWICMQYYSIAETVEWMYTYIHDAEKKMYTEVCPINREGRSYKENRSCLKWMTGKLSAYVLPISLGILAIIKLVSECRSFRDHWVFSCINIVLCVGLVVCSGMYLDNRIKKELKKREEKQREGYVE